MFGRCRGNTYDFLSASLCRVRLLSEPERGRTRIYNRGGAASGKELFQRGIHRLIITCDVNNQASAAVARRCGFELEGKMREARFAYGSYRDELLFAKINPGK